MYILDRSKIVAKLRESVDDIEEFSDIPQAETNASTDIPIFDVPEVVTPEPEKTESTDCVKKGKDSSPAHITNITQDLFDSITYQSESSVASSSKSTDISMTSEIMHVEPVDDKVEPSPENIESMDEAGSINDEPKISPDLPVNIEPESSNKKSITQPETAPSSLPTRAEMGSRP